MKHFNSCHFQAFQRGRENVRKVFGNGPGGAREDEISEALWKVFEWLGETHSEGQVGEIGGQMGDWMVEAISWN